MMTKQPLRGCVPTIHFSSLTHLPPFPDSSRWTLLGVSYCWSSRSSLPNETWREVVVGFWAVSLLLRGESRNHDITLSACGSVQAAWCCDENDTSTGERAKDTRHLAEQEPVRSRAFLFCEIINYFIVCASHGWGVLLHATKRSQMKKVMMCEPLDLDTVNNQTKK